MTTSSAARGVLLITVQAVALCAQGVVPAKQAVAVPMRDGASLATDLYLPAGVAAAAAPEPADRVPVVLVCAPHSAWPNRG